MEYSLCAANFFMLSKLVLYNLDFWSVDSVYCLDHAVGLVVGVSSRFFIAESPFQWGVLLTNKADIVLRFVLLKSKSPSFLSFSSMVVHAQLSTSFYFAGNELSK